MKPTQMTSIAEQDISEAVAFYESKRVGLGAEFLPDYWCSFQVRQIACFESEGSTVPSYAARRFRRRLAT